MFLNLIFIFFKNKNRKQNTQISKKRKEKWVIKGLFDWYFQKLFYFFRTKNTKIMFHKRVFFVLKCFMCFLKPGFKMIFLCCCCVLLSFLFFFIFLFTPRKMGKIRKLKIRFNKNSTFLFLFFLYFHFNIFRIFWDFILICFF